METSRLWDDHASAMLAVEQQVDSAAVWRRVARRLLPPLFAISLLCQLDRANLAFAALQMDAELGFSRTVYGMGSGLFFIGYLVQIPANMLCVVLGPYRWLPILLVCWGATATSFAAVSGIAGFLLLRLLLGVAEAGTYPAIMYLLSLFYPPHSLGVAYTCVASATAAAGLLGVPLAAALMLLDGIGGMRGFRWVFLVEGLLPILLAAALPFLLPSSPLMARFLAPAEQQWLWRQVHGHNGKDIELVAATATAAAAADQGIAIEPGHAGADCLTAQADDGDSSNSGGIERVALLQARQVPPSCSADQSTHLKAEDEENVGGHTEGQQSCRLSRAAVRAGLLDRRIWHLALVMSLLDFVMNGLTFWIPTLVKASLLGELQSDGASASNSSVSTGGGTPAMALLIKSSLLSALPFCGATVCMVTNAWHAKAADERRLHTAVPMVFAALGLAAVPLLALTRLGHALALVALTVAASGIWATHGPFFSWPSAFLDHEAAAIGFALVKTGGALGGFAGPFLVGSLADSFSGYTAAMLLLAGVAMAAAALVLVFNDQRQPLLSENTDGNL